MRIAMIGALAVIAAAPVQAQGKFRTGEINPARRAPTTVEGQVLGGVLGRTTDVRREGDSDRIPPGHLPPAGMCRVWIDGVPPGRQPAPTDCQTAVATRPANARVIWGDQSAFPGKGKGKFEKSNRDRDDDDRFENQDRRGGILGSVLPAQQQDAQARGKGQGNSKGKGKGKGGR